MCGGLREMGTSSDHSRGSNCCCGFGNKVVLEHLYLEIAYS